MLSQEKLCQLLKKTSLSTTLSDAEVESLANAGTVLEVTPGNFTIVEGEPSDSILALLDGEAEILKGKLDEKPYCIRNIGPGETLGELGFILNEPRSCSVRVTRISQVFSLNREAFERMLSNGDSASSKISMQLSKVMGQRMNLLTDETVKLLDEHDSLLATLEQMKTVTSASDVHQLRQKLALQTEQMRTKQDQLKKTVKQLNLQVKKAQAISTGLQVAIGAIAVSSVLGFAYIQGAFNGIFGPSSSFSSVTAIPELNNQEDCNLSGKLWCNDRCLDIER